MVNVGMRVAKADIDARVGQLAVSLSTLMHGIELAKATVDMLLDADLAAMGYGETDITYLRTILSDMETLRQVFNGSASLPSPKDFRAFLKYAWGFGG